MEDENGNCPTERDRRIVKLLTRGVPIGRIAERLVLMQIRCIGGCGRCMSSI